MNSILSLLLLSICMNNEFIHSSVVRPNNQVRFSHSTINADYVLNNNSKIPEQIHLSLGNDESKMTVTWNTKVSTSISLVRFGIGQFTRNRLGTSKKFTNGPNNVQYIHTAIMDKLEPNATYIYQVGDGNVETMSKTYSFKTLPSKLNWSPRFCVYGDLGYLNARSLPRIQQEVKKNMYDVILHVGDFAYDMDSNFGVTGDKFMRMMEPIAATIPYMTTPGNHENAQNFSNYKNRFRMPHNTSESMFYSYNVGPVHIVSISTEFYFYVYYGLTQLFNQMDWLINDLKTANLPENRAKRPWIILLGHRPLYCSNKGKDCTLSAEWLRYGIPGIHLLGLEDILFQYGVDLAFWAHEHSYERMWPVYKEKVVNSSTPHQPYTNPKSTVHIISGSAGCDENHDSFPVKDNTTYSAFHATDYGYSRVTVHNSTHLYFEQVSDDKDGKVIDSMTLIRTHHGSFV